MADKPSTETIEGTSPEKSKAQILTDVYSLATQFSTCVEAFNQIHPSKDHDHAQKVALAKLGLQQGRLLIFGDAVGISAPPATIARHMIPSHPGITNPDPHLPVNFGVRESKLDDEVVNAKVRKGLHEIAGRPANMSRDELMTAYGMKSPKSFNKVEYPALDTNRLEGFREKYALLQDLVRQSGARASLKRNMSMTVSHWTVKDSTRFNQFVKVVRNEVDTLIDLMGVKEQVDRGIRSDIRCMAWHPDLSGPIVKQDWEKLRLIKEACEVDYPEYVPVCESALQYITEELRETSLANRRASLGIPLNPDAAGGRRKSDYDIRTAPAPAPAVRSPAKASSGVAPETHLHNAAMRALDPNYGKEKRPGWLSAFKFKSWSKSSKGDKGRSMSVPGLGAPEDPQRSFSDVGNMPPQPTRDSEDDGNALQPVRSKSLSAMPDGPALDMDSRMKGLAIDEEPEPPTEANGTEKSDIQGRASPEVNALHQVPTVSSDGDNHGLQGATTVNSLVDRHDMYRGMGRIETKDIRDKTHEHVLGN